MAPYDAIRDACHLRFRPVVMTSAAAFLGGLPLMFSVGTGSGLRRPLGYARVGGLLVSQAPTLYTTPIAYLYLERLCEWRRSRGKSTPIEPRHAPAEQVCPKRLLLRHDLPQRLFEHRRGLPAGNQMPSIDDDGRHGIDARGLPVPRGGLDLVPI